MSENYWNRRSSLNETEAPRLPRRLAATSAWVESVQSIAPVRRASSNLITGARSIGEPMSAAGDTASATVASATPVSPAADRLHLIDTLRAIALFGVITMNMTGMVAALVSNEIFPVATTVDVGFATFDLVVLQGKARSCFALLFGVGFGILMTRAASRGQPFVNFYMTRMSVLGLKVDRVVR